MSEELLYGRSTLLAHRLVTLDEMIGFLSVQKPDWFSQRRVLKFMQAKRLELLESHKQTYFNEAKK